MHSVLALLTTLETYQVHSTFHFEFARSTRNEQYLNSPLTRFVMQHSSTLQV